MELVTQSIIGSTSSKNGNTGSGAPTVEPVQGVASRRTAKFGHLKPIAKPRPKPRVTNPPHFPSSDNEPQDSDTEDDKMFTSSSDSDVESNLRLAQVKERSGTKLPVEKPAYIEKPKQAAAPPVDEYANWDNGEPLTQEERQAVLRLKSNYERSREMNKRRNRRIQMELGLLDMDDIFKPKAKKHVTDDTEVRLKRKKGGEPTRRSERTKTGCVDT